MVSIYLDQNVYGHVLDHFSEDWRQHPIAKVLLKAQRSSIAQVWVGPEHIIETILSTDIARRQALAKVMLELCEARRVSAGSDFFAVRQFGRFVNEFSQDGFNDKVVFNRYESDAQHLWLGYLAILAACPGIELGKGVEEVRRTKLESQLIHARIMANPNDQIDSLIEAATNISTTENPDPLSIGQLSIQEIEHQIGNLAEKAVKPSTRTMQRIKKYRDQIATVYGTIELGAALNSIFWHPLSLELSFDASKIVAKWSELQKITNCPPLPYDYYKMDSIELQSQQDLYHSVLQRTILAAINANLNVTSIGYYALIRELEQAMNSGELPNHGATLDMNHAAAALQYGIFVCQDDTLADSVRGFLRRNHIEKTCVVRNPRQLEKVLFSRS